MTRRDNYLRAVRFEKPDIIPISLNINQSCWGHYPKAFLWEMIETHPILFDWFPGMPEEEKRQIENPIFRKNARKDEPYTDSWGCVWETSMDGIVGVVTHHPLKNLDSLAEYKMPDPTLTDGLASVNWEDKKIMFANLAKMGGLRMAGVPHGHTFLRLIDLLGYENLIFSMMDEDPRLDKLVGMIHEFNLEITKRYLECELDVVCFPEDLGMQQGPMLSPDNFRKYIKPSYQRLFAEAKKKDVHIYVHSDGDLRTLIDDLIDVDTDILNLQDLVNGVDWIRDNLKGRVCIDLDIDRQQFCQFGTPAEIDGHIKNIVQKLGSKDGGLMMLFGLYPELPLENMKAVMDAMERYAVV